MRDEPAGHGGRGGGERIATVARGAAQQQRHRAGTLGRELKPARLAHVDPPCLPDGSRQPAVPQPLLDQREQFGIVACLGVQHARRIEPRLVEAGREQVARAHDPQDRPLRPCQDAGDEQDGGRVVAPARSARRDLVQRAEPQAAIGQPRVERPQPERQNRRATPLAFDGPQRFTQLRDGGGTGHGDSQLVSSWFVLMIFAGQACLRSMVDRRGADRR